MKLFMARSVGSQAVLVEPELFEQFRKKVKMVRDRLQASQSRQKAYATEGGDPWNSRLEIMCS